MDDRAIVELYWQRSEKAISETQSKYGRFCHRIAYNVLANREDAEESVNDTYLAVWNALPPNRPAVFMTFLGKLARRIAINHWYTGTAEKRGGGQIPLVLDELEECESKATGVEKIAMDQEAYAALNRFLEKLPETQRVIFVRRYFMLDPVAQIAKSFHFSEAKVTSMLHRTRLKLRNALIEEGYL